MNVGNVDDVDRDYDVLPVVDFKEQLLDEISKNQIIICIGETGSGKTTQIPQFCLDGGLLADKCMAITQPRRVAAITVAERVAEERKVSIGTEVGYAIRFDDRTSSKTKIKFMTDGILVRECLGDRTLSRYQVIMLDEAHERSIHTDILFGLIKLACAQRPDLKLIVTSATLNIEKFSTYFNACPIIRVPGRVHPVDIYHSKARQVMTTSGPSTNGYIQSAADVVLRIHAEEDDGHILVFLTGQDEVERCCSLIRAGISDRSSQNKEDAATDMHLTVLPLYAALSSDLQRLVFKRVDSNWRKVVVATNIAETSVTVPHVRYVVDAGYVKQKVYDPSRHMESLVVVPISQVSAEQRAGRAGRTAPGKCYRLYSSDCLSLMTRETIPEIQRSNLSNVILQLKALGIHDVIGFDFLDPPSSELIAEALVSLHLLGGLEDNGYLTYIGKRMTAFSVEPVLSRMILGSISCSNKHSLDAIIVVAAMMSVEDIWITKHRRGPRREDDERASRQQEEEQQRAETAHNALRHPLGDYHTYLKVFRKWSEAGSSQEWCHQHFIRFRSLRMAAQIRSQLWDEAVSSRSVDRSQKPGDREEYRHLSSREERELDLNLCSAVVCGIYMNAARRCTNETIFRTLPLIHGVDDESVDVRLLHLHPSCTLLVEGTHNKKGQGVSQCPPEMVLYQEVVVGAKPLMRHVMVADLVAKQVNRKREDWKFVSPSQLSGREPPCIAVDVDGDGDSSAVGNTRKRSLDSTKSDGKGDIEGDRQRALNSAKERYSARKKK
eukprot:gene6647-13457_t